MKNRKSTKSERFTPTSTLPESKPLYISDELPWFGLLFELPDKSRRLILNTDPCGESCVHLTLGPKPEIESITVTQPEAFEDLACECLPSSVERLPKGTRIWRLKNYTLGQPLFIID